VLHAPFAHDIDLKRGSLSGSVAVRSETQGRVLLLTLDRPEALNAIDPAMQEALVAAWQRFRDDDALRVAVVTGAGDRAFSAGVDLKQMGQLYRGARDSAGARWTHAPGIGGLTRNFDPGKPVIAAVNGHCLGAGLELALACDLRIASENATFGLPETRWAIIPGQGGTQRLPRIVAPNIALEMILTGAPISAQRALEIGLVNRVVPLPSLVPTALELAQAIAHQHPQAIRHARAAVYRGLQLPLEQGLAVEQELAEPLRDSEDNREARAAFAEKRPPRWARDGEP
jgi:enoyl-CoA hydratase/carnithine racemase